MINRQDQKTQSARWATSKLIYSSLEKRPKLIYRIDVPIFIHIRDEKINVISDNLPKALRSNQKIVGKQKYKKRKNSM